MSDFNGLVQERGAAAMSGDRIHIYSSALIDFLLR